jgi:hypothetical protein
MRCVFDCVRERKCGWKGRDGASFCSLTHIGLFCVEHGQQHKAQGAEEATGPLCLGPARKAQNGAQLPARGGNARVHGRHSSIICVSSSSTTHSLTPSATTTLHLLDVCYVFVMFFSPPVFFFSIQVLSPPPRDEDTEILRLLSDSTPKLSECVFPPLPNQTSTFIIIINKK